MCQHVDRDPKKKPALLRTQHRSVAPSGRVGASRLNSWRPGDFPDNETGDSLFVVASGRVIIGVSQGDGQERLVDYLGVGDHFGEMALLTGGRRSVTVTAVIDSDLLELKHDAFQQLLLTVPGLAANVCRTLSYRLRRETVGRRRRPMPQIVGLVCSTPRTEEFLPRIAEALASQGTAVRVLADRTQQSGRDLSYAVERIPPRLESSECAADPKTPVAGHPATGPHTRKPIGRCRKRRPGGHALAV